MAPFSMPRFISGAGLYTTGATALNIMGADGHSHGPHGPMYVDPYCIIVLAPEDVNQTPVQWKWRREQLAGGEGGEM